MPTDEPVILIETREQLFHTLAEAAEIEHNLMCCYLYAAWSLKTEADDGVPDDVRAELRRWHRTIVSVAVDEMTHLALVGNLINAIGGIAHFDRPNFPIGIGYHPAGMNVLLAPFDRDTLQHFIHLERPEGSDEPDGQRFKTTISYSRGLNGLKVMPSAQDFATVGHLYRSLAAGLVYLSDKLGETQLFCGDPALQVGPEIVRLDGLGAITNLQSALTAIDVIVEQGEGAPEQTENGHFQRFISVRQALGDLLAADPEFRPAFPAAINPVMRRPPDGGGKVWVNNTQSLAVMEVANATYAQMLRCLYLGFASTMPDEKRAMIDLAIDLMQAIEPLARELARMKANDTDSCNAGISFATLRSVATPVGRVGERTILLERLDELSRAADGLPSGPRTTQAARALGRLRTGAAEAAPPDLVQARQTSAGSVPVADAPAPDMPAAPAAPAAPEIVEGGDLTLIVDGKRCIHVRYCVTGAPKTFIANVAGPWLHPDETPVERLVEIAHACPSGAVSYRRKDGRPDEAAPPVNLMRLRENGPYAVHAPLILAGEETGFRATLCRCGQSRNKPYCDGSHHAAGFIATGEPATISLASLASRDGPLRIDPQRDGPLSVSGNLEICTGGGTVVKRVTEARLCRCGQSGTKPLCDGSHRRVGFAAPGV